MASEKVPPVPPKHPFETNWYVQGQAQALGPLTGYVLKEMIARAEVGRDTNIAEVGAMEWTRLADVPVFAALLPPALPGAPGQEAQALDTGLQYAGFWIRLLAYIIDAIVMEAIALFAGVVLGIVLVVTGLSGAMGLPEADHHYPLPPGFTIAFWIVGFAVTIAYNVYFNSGKWQATPGKRLLGLHLITVTGEPVSAGLAFGRWAAYILDGLTLDIGFLMIAWTREKTGLHDILCGTRVVYGKL
ncbi:MAG: RDD family protein [Methylovirgula sp.]|nr:RDD family protein [Methylovirgula sp.]